LHLKTLVASIVTVFRG